MQGQTVRWETLVPAHIRSIQAYIPSKPDDVLRDMFHCPSIHRLNNNENALGPAKEAQAAIAAFDPAAAAIYPSGDAFHLRQRLAQNLWPWRDRPACRRGRPLTPTPICMDPRRRRPVLRPP